MAKQSEARRTVFLNLIIRGHVPTLQSLSFSCQSFVYSCCMHMLCFSSYIHLSSLNLIDLCSKHHGNVCSLVFHSLICSPEACHRADVTHTRAMFEYTMATGMLSLKRSWYDARVVWIFYYRLGWGEYILQCHPRSHRSACSLQNFLQE